jgi:hypothetical protein
VIAAIPPFTAV